MTTRAANSRALARELARRCRGLRELGLDAAAAERQAFEEFFDRHGPAAAAWPDLYPDFLDAYAPEQRRAHGIYYTPAAVVNAQVRLTADLLRTRLGVEAAFGDERVLIVDPAAGSGAYPLAIVELLDGPRARAKVAARMRLFEPMAGAASIARALGFTVEEADALRAVPALEAPVVVCLGNPPYARRKAPVGLERLRLEDFHAPGGGVHLKNLHNEYVYFWRWALSVVFERRPGPGIVSFLTAASYLRGPGFEGVRSVLRRVLDELWIVDLEGDQRAARPSQNVFATRTPVALALGVRYAGPQAESPASVHYARLGGSSAAKLATLAELRRVSDLEWQSVAAVSTSALAPRVASAYMTWPALTDLFPWQVSGAQLKRTWPIGPTPAVLRARWKYLLSLPLAERSQAFVPSRDRDLESTPPDLRAPGQRLAALRTLEPDAACVEPTPYAYRSFDRHWVLPDARLGDFMRPALWRAAGPRQVFLTSFLTGVLGPGPAAVATRHVPDLDCFRGSFGARAVVPLWLDAAATRPNVSADWLERLTQRYGFRVGARALMAYAYAVLGTRDYVARFEEELRTPGPRVPLTGHPALFLRTVALGEQLLALHVAQAIPVGRARWSAAVDDTYPTVASYDRAALALRVGSGIVAPVAPAVWEYSVSGLRVVPSWLRRRLPGRRARSTLDAIGPTVWPAAFTGELLELVWLLEATLDLEPALTAALAEIVRGDRRRLPA